MGLLLSLQTVYEVGRITLPSFVEVLAGKLERETGDARLRSFGQRVVDRARIRLEVEGYDLVPTDRAFVYMSNHQSHVDIPVLYATVPARTLRMVAKTELFRIPIWGRALREGGFVEVDRGNHAQAVASIERAKDALRQGVSIWIAPEGSRTRTGTLGPLKKGGFHLAAGTGTPIVPVALSGTRHVLPPGARHMQYDCAVRVVFGAPIPTEGRAIPALMADVETFLRANVR